jgi:uncharacterized membrane protein YciS (DUF1049 family)
MASQWIAVITFTVIFVAGYAIIWGIIYLTVRHSTAKLNERLNKE